MFHRIPLISTLLLSATLSTVQAVDKPFAADNAYWTAQPFCSGRYTI